MIKRSGFSQLACALLVTSTVGGVLSVSTASAQDAGTDLQATVDVLINKLAAKNAEIVELKARIEQLDKDSVYSVSPMIGCSVDEAKRVIVSEQFLYDRERVLLEWLSGNIAQCKLLELQELSEIAQRTSLNQSNMLIRKEAESRELDNSNVQWNKTIVE